MLFKVLLLVFDCLQGLAQAKLQSTITLHIPGRSGLRRYTRSLETRTTKTTRRQKRRSRRFPYQRQPFTNFAPVYWNKLPAVIRSTTNRGEFKRLLKTHFFLLYLIPDSSVVYLVALTRPSLGRAKVRYIS